MADIEYSTRAADWLRDAEPDVSERVMSKLEQAVEWPDHFLDALSGVPCYKLRVGDYRAIIDWRRDDDVLFVRRVDRLPQPTRIVRLPGISQAAALVAAELRKGSGARRGLR